MGRGLVSILVLATLGILGCSDGLTPAGLERINDGGMGGQSTGGPRGSLVSEVWVAPVVWEASVVRAA